jgi:hypothetical protein
MQSTINVNKRVWLMLTGVVVFAFIGFMIYNTLKRPIDGGYIKIANISEFTRGRPTNRLALATVEHGLFMKVNEYISVKSNGVKDMKVRVGTFEQIDDGDYHRVSMVVDSDSLQQSYRFFYQWGEESRFEQYGGVIFCVNPDEVIFNEFKCEDMSSVQAGNDTEIDILTELLPITTTEFKIRANIIPRPAEIVITVRVPAGQTDDTLISLRYQNALALLRQRGVNLSLYARAICHSFMAQFSGNHGATRQFRKKRHLNKMVSINVEIPEISVILVLAYHFILELIIGFMVLLP